MFLNISALILFFGLFFSPLVAQSNDANQIESITGEIALCSDVDVCVNIPLIKNQGSAYLTNGFHATLVVQHIDATNVVLRREDHDGPSAGFIGDYTGTRTGNWLEGTVVFNWPGHPNPPLKGTWRALLLPPVAVAKDDKEYLQSLPKATAWKVCMDPGDGACSKNGGLNGVWVLDGGRGHSRFLVQPVATNFLIVDRFDETAVELRSMDMYGNFTGLSGQFIGTRQGNSMQGTLKFLWPGHPESPHTGKWSATALPLNCKGQPNLNIANAKIFAQVASMVADAPGDAQCTLIAAKQGDAQAQEHSGYLYYMGIGVAKDVSQTLYWLTKSADQNYPSAMLELAILYEKGEGVPKDLLAANYLKNSGLSITRAANPQFKGGVGPPGLAVLGNLLGYVASGQAAADTSLADTIQHQHEVLRHIAAGMSRVDAEQLLFDKEEKEAGKPRTDECTLPKDTSSGSGYTIEERRTNQNAQDAKAASARNEYDRCVEDAKAVWVDAHNRRVDYMQCVIDNVDSNVIETKCKYRP